MAAIKNINLTVADLHNALHYESWTGDFYWVRCAPNKKFRNGTKAGSKNGNGYIYIKIDGIHYYAHRLAWLYMTGAWPIELDHINGNKSDNKWANLREATVSQNQLNRGKPCRGKLPKGVWYAKTRTSYKKYGARIEINKVVRHLGYWANPEDAGEAYIRASMAFAGEFSWYRQKQ